MPKEVIDDVPLVPGPVLILKDERLSELSGQPLVVLVVKLIQANLQGTKLREESGSIVNKRSRISDRNTLRSKSL